VLGVDVAEPVSLGVVTMLVGAGELLAEENCGTMWQAASIGTSATIGI